jgi:hypothetical protein
MIAFAVRAWMFILLLTVAIFAQTAEKPSPSTETLVTVPLFEAARHRNSGPPVVRVTVDELKKAYFEPIKVLLTVDTSGAVVSASTAADQDPELRCLSRERFVQAEAAAKTMHFTPFQRGGHPVTARFQYLVMLMPPAVLPSRHVPFPEVKDWKSARITLDRKECLPLGCPDYTVEVHGDGSTIYEGRGYVAFTGKHSTAIPEDNVRELVRLFREADYFSFEDIYPLNAANKPREITSIEIDGVRKQVAVCAGVLVGQPDSFYPLANAIDRLSMSDLWVKGTAGTVAALKAEHWDFNSPEAAAALARLASRDSADAVREMVKAGVTTVEKDGWESALVSAAGLGDQAMFSILLGATAEHNQGSLDHALIAAAGSGDVEVFRLLITSGANTRVHDLSGRTILTAAAGSGVPAMLREALKYVTDVDALAEAPIRTKGGTALMAAVSENLFEADPEGVDRPEIVRALLEAGAKVDARDRHGNTALMLCTTRVDLALLLIKAGADVNATNDRGLNPLRTTYDKQMKQFLQDHGARW